MHSHKGKFVKTSLKKTPAAKELFRLAWGKKKKDISIVPVQTPRHEQTKMLS